MDSNQDSDVARRPGAASVAAWLLCHACGSPRRLEALVLSLESAFRSGVSVPGAAGALWHTRPERLLAEEQEVQAQLRLSPTALPPLPDVPRGSVEWEEGSRELFPEETSGAADLVLLYPFSLRLPLEENLALFREFAHAELLRLRGGPSPP